MADKAQVQPKPVDWEELFPGRFLKAGLFLGKKPTLTISDVQKELLPNDKGGKTMKGIISFAGKDMGLALNKTNGLCLKAMFGRHLAAWEGKRVTLYTDRWNGDDCIRIWGSPDIDEDIEVVIALPQKKPFTMTMHSMKPKPASAPKEEPKPAPEPPVEENGDSEPGF